MSAPTSRQRPKRRRSGLLWIALLATALATVSTVSLTPPLVWRLEDASGKPLRGAWAAYHFLGTRFNPVDSGSFTRDGAVVRVGEDGVLRIGRRLHLHAPWPLEGDVAPFVDLVYVPALHNAFGPVGELTDDRAEGPVAIDRGRGVLVFRDLADDPDAWEASLRQLHSFVRHELLPGLDGEREPGYEVDPATPRALSDLVTAELDAFLARHGASPRTAPPEPYFWRTLSPAELAEHEAAIAADLAREPLWGPYAEKMWRDRVVELAATAKER